MSKRQRYESLIGGTVIASAIGAIGIVFVKLGVAGFAGHSRYGSSSSAVAVSRDSDPLMFWVITGFVFGFAAFIETLVLYAFFVEEYPILRTAAKKIYWYSPLSTGEREGLLKYALFVFWTLVLLSGAICAGIYAANH